MNQTLYSKITNEIKLPRDLVCFSHLRWNFVYQRPQHLLTRFSKHFRLFYFEEPLFTENTECLHVSMPEENICIIVPYIHQNQSPDSIRSKQRELIEEFFKKMEITDYVFWYYTPMALSFTSEFTPRLTVYDCMDELSAFKFAPPEIKKLEAELLSKADLVFTGGHSLYEAKKNTHPDIHPFPSSIDIKHFSKARTRLPEPEDQKNIPYPRLGFYGVIDERMNIDLIGEIASQRPDWHFIIIGPVVKIDPATLPSADNIHYLGSKTYEELPSYLSGWDISLIPFALNESTRYISPTKTPEYLSAGKPVISTSIRDVINPYKIKNLVHIADSPDEFIRAAETEFNTLDKSEWLRDVDRFLSGNSWDNTWERMMDHITIKLKGKTFQNTKTKEQVYV